tara:strand:+ start:1025 stop:1873 length:849 start_codon:yes stop_codon:yes gene_type:complete
MPFSARAGFMATNPDGAPWTPAEITSLIWVDALTDAQITYGAGITVNSWAQRNGNTAFTSSANKPLYDSVNKSVSFDGTNDFLQAATVFGVGSNPALTTIALITPLNIPSGQNRFLQMGEGGTTAGSFPTVRKPVALSYGTNSTDGLASFQFNTGYERYNHIASSSTQFLASYVRPSGGDYQDGSYYLNGTEKTRIDGSGDTETPDITGAITELGRGQDETVTGSFYPPAYKYAQVRIHELVTVEASDITTRQLIEGYMAWRWGVEGDLPVGHPYKTARPTT